MSFNDQGEWIDDGKEYVKVHDWCPACDPVGPPEPWVQRPCALHHPQTDGLDDRGVRGDTYLSGSAEAGGADNAAFCALFRSKPQ